VSDGKMRPSDIAGSSLTDAQQRLVDTVTPLKLTSWASNQGPEKTTAIDFEDGDGHTIVRVLTTNETLITALRRLREK
jgi:hypothetical protein